VIAFIIVCCLHREEIMLVLKRLVSAGLVAALAVALGGWVLERARFGASDDAAVAHVEAEIQQRFDASADTLGMLAAQAATRRDLFRAAPRDPAAARQLFDALNAALPEDESTRTGVTVYDAADTPLGWTGRVSEPPKELNGPASLLVAAGALGPRLIRIEPVLGPAARRLATIVVEQILEPIESSPALGERFVVSTSLAPVTLRVAGAPSTQAPIVFSIASRSGGTLVRAEVRRSDLTAARERWRRRTAAAVLTVLAITLLLCAGPLVELRRLARTPRAVLVASGAIGVVLVSSGLMFRAMPIDGPRPVVGPLDLLLTSLMAAALVWLAIDLLERRRLARPRARLLVPSRRAMGLVAAAYLAAALLDVALLWMYGRFLQSIVSGTTVDLLHFSLHPLDATRLGLAFGLVMLHAAVIWTAVTIIRLPHLFWRTPSGTLSRVAALAWSSGGLLGLAAARASAAPVPPMPLLVALAATGGCAIALSGLRGRTRHASQTLRLGALFLALLAPAAAMYPSMLAFATQAKEKLIAKEYGPAALNLRADLQRRVQRTREQLDALPSLPGLVTTPSDAETPTAYRSFVVWSQTDLETSRLTSAVELYRSDGRLVSRFALNLPEYSTGPYIPRTCEWALSDDVSPIGANEPHVLRASRGICVRGRIVGGVAVRAMLDYRTLPFISPENPYLESLRPDRQVPLEAVSGRDVEFAVYGWSRAPIFVSGTSVWTLSDAVFQRAIESRTPFWDTVIRDDDRFRVYFMNDRGGIYALGYPVITTFGHLINLAELVTLVLALFTLLIVGAALFSALTSRTPASARALLREVRSSFYRKLFLAFWAVAVVPVVILAFATRAYLVTELNAGVEDAAAKTVTVAQRLVEDYATLQQRGPGAFEPLDDEIMVLVSRAIDEDVNLFDRARLQATSAYDLFASQLLSPRTPADVYRALALDRAPTFVGVQQFGTVPYVLAAAPVRTAGREGIVTVPLTLRQQQTERQIDDLTRRLLFAAVLFSLLGGALGYWMAELIADPVNRLTRATRRIARGDLDARIAATSSDELGRLVEDFNQMAADLKRRRSELERTQRLEAWADMARQVAHDIKNPLTPIQLSAEHARRVNIDRGRPLSPALDECVTAILGQVRLLRQIATEFSNFASSPTPHPKPTALASLIDEVVAPYRTGLAGRIAIDVSVPDDLPIVTIDRSLFARALTNIIENALHAMPGDGRLSVTAWQSAVRSQQATSITRQPPASHPSVILEISDTGVGMDQEALTKIFEPYFSTKATGTGLGLTIAKRNVELNDGTIEVRSQRGVGTNVTIFLPVESPSA